LARRKVAAVSLDIIYFPFISLDSIFSSIAPLAVLQGLKPRFTAEVDVAVETATYKPACGDIGDVLASIPRHFSAH
jgi:hypothetical protein